MTTEAALDWLTSALGEKDKTRGAGVGTGVGVGVGVGSGIAVGVGVGSKVGAAVVAESAACPVQAVQTSKTAASKQTPQRSFFI